MSIAVQQPKSWKPDRPTSRGATAFHNAVINGSWINDIMYELIKIVKPLVHKGDTVVDFGAGTGTSSMLLLKYLQKGIRLWLVDNSPSWLGKAYELLNDPPNVECFILGKEGDRYATLAETVGNGVVDHVISANTFHLIPNLLDAFNGIAASLKNKGTFTLQTGNFLREDRPKGALMIDDTIEIVHDTSLGIIRKDPNYAVYRKGLDERVKIEEVQRKFIFPDPRPIKTYLDALKQAKFEYDKPLFIPVKVRYSDWLNFLRVKRLQAGILPEVGGKNPSLQEEKDRDKLITVSTLKLFKDLKLNNPLADDKQFTIDLVYIFTKKQS
jgi:SAM-dependent methyltransferase